MRTLEQQRDALTIANSVRLFQAKWKRETGKLTYSEGCALVARLLEDDEALASPLGALKISQTLQAIHHFGPASTQRVLMRADIRSGERRLRDLTEGQRARVALLLESKVDA